MERRLMVQFVGLVVLTMLFAVLGPAAGSASAATPPVGPLRAGTDGVIYDAANRPVRLVGFNWTGTENGGRSDFLKSADVCGVSWRIPSDGIGGLPFDYDNMYQVIRDSGYNVIRIPVSWNNLEPVAPVWDVGSSSYRHSWNVTYLEDLKSMVSKARAVGLMVILDMHQDYWSPALRQITNWDGSRGYCEGVGMPRWLYPTIDAKESTTQNVDFYNGMNWFFRNIHDPLSTVTRETPWQLLYATWDFLAHQFSAESGFPDYQAVVAADLFNEPYFSYVGGNPPAGRTVLQAAGDRLRTFYEALAPAITTRNPSWLLLFQDCTGGYNIANPSLRETPTIPARPAVAGNWVYSLHLYNFAYGTFSDGVPRHDDFGLTLADVAYAKAQEWGVPLLIGEFTNFNLGVDARQLTDADMEQTRLFLNWAKEHGVSWTFWSYVNPYRPMTLVDYTTNQVIPVVERALASGLDSPDTNQAPVASFTSVCGLLACTFDGSSSSDPDGSIATYAWDFGDGSADGSGVRPGHTYAAAGRYTVTLTVTDDDGSPDQVRHDVVVVAPPQNQPPEAAFSHSVDGLRVSFVGSASSDPDGTITKYAWDFGDGSADGAGASPSHTYASSGTYTVTLTVTDDDQATDSVSGDVVVVAPPPLDADGDGVVDGQDGCPTVPGPASSGGCPAPPPDADGDGVVDGQDGCPTVPGPASSGGCPPPPTARVKVTARSARSELHVNVDPNRGTGYWRFHVERKRADGTWQRLKTYRTKGSRETRTINLRRGTYRVWVHAKYGHEAALSGEVRLRK